MAARSVRGRSSRLPGQFSLPGLDGSPSVFEPEPVASPREAIGYTLFLAIVPELGDARRIALFGDQWCERFGLVGTRVGVERLHVTLHALDFFAGTISQQLIDAAKAAASSVDGRRFPIVFDRVVKFKDDGAFAFRCDADSDAAIAKLRQMLAAVLRRNGLKPDASRTPHMTMVYSRGLAAEHAIDPLGWTATRFDLILSHVGQTHHELVARYALR